MRRRVVAVALLAVLFSAALLVSPAAADDYAVDDYVVSDGSSSGASESREPRTREPNLTEAPSQTAFETEAIAAERTQRASAIYWVAVLGVLVAVAGATLVGSRMRVKPKS